MRQSAETLLRVALVEALTDDDPHELTTGVYEIQAGIEGRTSGHYSQIGIHGRLQILDSHCDAAELLTAAIGLLTVHIPLSRRQKVLSSIPDEAVQVVRDYEQGETAPHRTAARRLLRGLQHRTGVRWRATPTYQPKK
jgi:hypothetical protein